MSESKAQREQREAEERKANGNNETNAEKADREKAEQEAKDKAEAQRVKDEAEAERVKREAKEEQERREAQAKANREAEAERKAKEERDRADKTLPGQGKVEGSNDAKGAEGSLGNPRMGGVTPGLDNEEAVFQQHEEVDRAKEDLNAANEEGFAKILAKQEEEAEAIANNTAHVPTGKAADLNTPRIDPVTGDKIW